MRPPVGTPPGYHWVRDDKKRTVSLYWDGVVWKSDIDSIYYVSAYKYEYIGPVSHEDAEARASLEEENKKLREEVESLKRAIEFKDGIFKITAEKLQDRWTKHAKAGNEIRKLREAFRVNVIRLCPSISHEEIDVILNNCRSNDD